MNKKKKNKENETKKNRPLQGSSDSSAIVQGITLSLDFSNLLSPC